MEKLINYTYNNQTYYDVYMLIDRLNISRSKIHRMIKYVDTKDYIIYKNIYLFNERIIDVLFKNDFIVNGI